MPIWSLFLSSQAYSFAWSYEGLKLCFRFLSWYQDKQCRSGQFLQILTKICADTMWHHIIFPIHFQLKLWHNIPMPLIICQYYLWAYVERLTLKGDPSVNSQQPSLMEAVNKSMAINWNWKKTPAYYLLLTSVAFNKLPLRIMWQRHKFIILRHTWDYLGE